MSRGGDPFRRSEEALAELLENSTPGSVLPSEPALAKQFGVSRATLREAMKGFEDRGLIERRQGVGTYVRPRVLDAGLEELVSIESMAAKAGLEVEMGDSEIRYRPAKEKEAKLLGAENVVELSRVILADGEPVAYLIDTLGESLIPKSVLEKEFHGSVLDLLLERGELELEYSDSEISATPASEDIARRLVVPVGTVLMLFDADLYTREGEIVDRSRSYFLPGIFKFHVVRRVGRGLGTAA